MSKKFEKVIAFDVSCAAVEVAKKRYGNTEKINFICKNNIREAGIARNTVDMILSVTVLGHIMGDSELIQTINHFRDILTKDGTIIAMEYATDYEKPTTSPYQRYMKLKEWQSIFLQCGFHLHKYYGFYHPIEIPCRSYSSYARRFQNFRGKILRLFLNRFNHDIVNRHLNRLANKYIRGQNDFFGQEDQQQSPTKIMIFRKQGI